MADILALVVVLGVGYLAYKYRAEIKAWWDVHKP